jgi:hypothetical protein
MDSPRECVSRLARSLTPLERGFPFTGWRWQRPKSASCSRLTCRNMLIPLPPGRRVSRITASGLSSAMEVSASLTLPAPQPPPHPGFPRPCRSIFAAIVSNHLLRILAPSVSPPPSVTETVRPRPDDRYPSRSDFHVGLSRSLLSVFVLQRPEAGDDRGAR